MRVFSFLCLCVLLQTPLISQSVHVSSTLDSHVIETGDQIGYTLQVEFPAAAHVQLPLLSDTLSRFVEILAPMHFDTIALDDGMLKYSHSYLITAFDSGKHVIHPNPVIVSFDSVRFDTLYDMPKTLTVAYFPADSSGVIRDIVPPIHPGITFREIWKYILMGILLLLLIFALWYYFRYHRRGKVPAVFEKPKIQPHVIALKALDELQEKKLWQNKQQKLYWSRLSEILRTYFEDRFYFPAMESVTEDIMKELPLHIKDNETIKKACDLLLVADMVKFAKEEPLPDQNSRAIKEAYEIVDSTTEKEDVDDKSSENNEEKLPQEKS